MGCSQSKIENEEAVARCKDRKNFMKQAVSARNAFAAAHSSYATYLKSTGAALSDFADGQVQFSQFPTTTSSAVPPPIPAAQQSSFKIPPPPPPLPPPFPDLAPLQRSVTMPEIKLTRPESNPVGTIIEEDEHDVELESESLRRGRRRTTKTAEREEPLKQPPQPPLQRTENVNRHLHHLDSSSRDDHDHVTQNSAWEYFFPAQENVPATSLKDAEEIEQQHQHHQHQHHLENDEEDDEEEEDEEIHREVFEEKLPEEPVPVEVVAPPPVVTAKELKKVKQPQQAAVEGIESGGKHQSVNLIQIFNDLDDHFLKASESAHEVSKMLEATRLHYHSNFADNRGSK